MRGSSRAAVIEGRPAFESALTSGDPAVVADELFAVVGLLDDNPTLRRGVADPSREGTDKSGLVTQLLAGKISEDTIGAVASLAAQRWASERDLTDTLERFAVEATLKGAEDNRAIDQVEDELFRFERVVAGNPELRDALGNRQGDRAGKAELVSTLLADKVRPETLRLARQAVLAPRGRRFARVVEEYLEIAAERRQQYTAVVMTAVDLTDAQRTRLSDALQQIYGKAVQLHVVHDEDVIGGIRVQIGDEVVDGTVLHRLHEAQRHLAG
ncbi:F0F1 ATP synthase subunit delta [Janibacter cremeus]|uniref:ATP synthase subunit delta n=1 Tax=Janibacter cremeus TaxID=1285192 RepID=A0A852VPF0_9MICO|nr:F0F1 ATP synthase subunit delta [Janibacter cremeus]NYF97340.1 F-type H+-transporting ATPase subunit delta [Janibacter cremeus]